MNEYDKYFTFEKAETEEDKNRAYQIIDRLFVYLYPYLGGSRSDYMTSAIAKAAKETGVLLSIAEEGYPEIRKMIKKNALNSERAFNELKEVGIDLEAQKGIIIMDIAKFEHLLTLPLEIKNPSIRVENFNVILNELQFFIQFTVCKKWKFISSREIIEKWRGPWSILLNLKKKK